MKTKEFFALDPYNNIHLDMLQAFEQNYNLEPSLSKELLSIRQNYNQEDYIKKSHSENELNQQFCYCKDNTIIGHCIFYIQKDIKSCHITFTKLQNTTQNSQIIPIATEYALDVLGMEEVFSSTPPNDTILTTHLTNNGYENLGTDEGLTCFVIEKSQLDTVRKKNNGIS